MLIRKRLSEELCRELTRFIDENYEETMLSFTGKMCLGAEPVDDGCVYERTFSMPAPAMSLKEMLRCEDAGFTETLLHLIDKTGKKDSQIYKRANISKQHFSKIRNNPHYQPTKPTAIALALALELDVDQTNDLIGRAGYTLTNSSKFDLIIRYFIEQRNFNIVEINLALYEFDQPILGS